MIFCDISESFDRVWYTGLLFKLRQYRVGGQLLACIRDYLSHRQQSVSVGSAKSLSRPVNAGVPQGSVPRTSFFPCLRKRYIR